MILVLLSIEGIYDHNLESARHDPSNKLIEGEYDYYEYSTMITFKADLEDSGAIWFQDSGPAAIDLAFRIQQGYPEPLRVVHEDYLFDLVISDFDSAADLSDAMDKTANAAA